MTSYLCGIDIGGTFTDCVLVDDSGRVVTAKSPSTPEDFADGMMAALESAAAKVGVPLPELCRSISMLSHGTTVGTNAIVQRRGARVGLITTKGHNDVIHIMRGSRGLSGEDVRLVVHFPESRKPDPIVPKRLIAGVSERVDCLGNIVVPLNESEAEAAVRRLLEMDVQGIAICFLWSFLESSHERRVKEIVESLAPEIFVTCSHELVPKWGEYERTTAVSLNAYIGPITTGYLSNIERRLAELGYGAPLQITQCAGGTIPVETAMHAPLLTLDSGPVSGVTGTQYSAALMGYENVITTDMGGTSFDIGVIHGGEPAFSFRSHVHQYEYYLPKVDIQTIGSGGGSKVWINEATQTLRVGPESAGAVPGPVCYKQGGEVPTVTDADLVLGYLDSEHFAEGTMRLDRAAAERAIGTIAERLGMELYECAAGIAHIVEFQMADLIRKVTIQKGFDPRDFVLFAFGGAGPVHAAVFARELGVGRVIVPQRETASVWCAFGAAAADILHVYEQVEIMVSPFEADRINRILASLHQRAAAQLDTDGAPRAHRHFRFSADLRHKGQINEVEVDLDGDTVNEQMLAALRERFIDRYERLYGRGASLDGARLELVTVRCRASAEMSKPSLKPRELRSDGAPETARRRSRRVYWSEFSEHRETAVYDGHGLNPGNVLSGPAIVELDTTTVVVRPDQRLNVDAYGNLEIHVATGTGAVSA
jgi:N-methylhydantoinase A